MRRTLNFVVMAVMAQFLVLRVAKLVAGGFSWVDIVWVHVYLIGIAIALVWELHGRHASQMNRQSPQPAPSASQGPPLWSLVALLRQGTPLAADDLRGRLTRALGVPIGEHAGDPNALRPGDGDVAFVLRLAGQRLAIVNEAKPYVKDREAEATTAASRELAVAIVQHAAWRAVDWLDGSPADRPAVYATLARTLAELTSDVEPLALFCPETGQMTPWSDDVLAALRSGDAPKAFAILNEPSK
jgi:hypothetical protein